MGFLSLDELRGIDSALDQHTAANPLFTYARPDAVVHLLKYAEGRDAELQMSGKFDDAEYNAISRNDLDALRFELSWVRDWCTDGYLNSKHKTSRRDWGSMNELRRMSTQYAKVWDYMSALFKGYACAERIGEKTISVEWPDKDALLVSVSDRMILEAYEVELADAGGGLDFPVDADGVLKQTKARIVGSTLKMEHSEQLFELFVRKEKARIAAHARFDSSWDLGGYTVDELRRSLVVLRALLLVRRLALVGLGGHRSRASVWITRSSAFCEQLSLLSGVPCHPPRESEESRRERRLTGVDRRCE